MLLKCVISFGSIIPRDNYIFFFLSLSLSQVFDLFCPRLTDRNSKVNLRALEAFSNIVPLLCDTLTPVATNIVTALVPNLASRNATIHSSAMTALDLLIQCIGEGSLYSRDYNVLATARQQNYKYLVITIIIHIFCKYKRISG